MSSRLALRLMAEGEFLYFGVEKDVERLPQLPLDTIVVPHPQLLEERLIAGSSQRIIQTHIQLVAVARQSQTVVQVGLGLVVFHVPGLDLHLQEREAPADALLLALEQVDGDGPGVVGLEQLAALVQQRGPLALVAMPLPAGDVMQLVELADDQFAQGDDDVFGYLDAPVVVLDGGLDVGHVHGAPLAFGAFGMPARAQEIWIDDALAAPRVAQDKPGIALTAIDAAFQIMVVGLRLLSGEVVVGQDRLNPVPDLFGHQRLMQAVISCAPERDLALVVGVGQDAVHRRQSGGLGRALGGRNAGQAPVDQLLAQRDGRIPAGRVGLERPFDQWRPLRVGLDPAYLAAQLVALAHVEIPDRGLARRAAGDRFLRHALGYFGGEVAAVELGDRGHDAMHQQPRGRLVDVLGHRHQRDPGLLQREMDGHVVGPVAGQPVDLVHDAIGDIVGLDVFDHAQQLGPVGLARRLAGVHELLDDDGVKFAGLAQVRLPLRRDREALLSAAALGLLFGRDAQVRDRQRRGLARGGFGHGVLCDGHDRVSLPNDGADAGGGRLRGATR
ncbi:MAG: hypothetical protein LKK45_02685 [Bifidobacterium psychraerophilum]|nr:hypothetical protein [Bifidobacterium psychraerophilum]MCI1659682.1 hypothetical protein [Bifidobacterium psychraerophilum]MCI2176074.1 hypothetical protein [Bifidobacterium psychraerophilum]